MSNIPRTYCNCPVGGCLGTRPWHQCVRQEVYDQQKPALAALKESTGQNRGYAFITFRLLGVITEALDGSLLSRSELLPLVNDLLGSEANLRSLVTAFQDFNKFDFVSNPNDAQYAPEMLDRVQRIIDKIFKDTISKPNDHTGDDQDSA